MTAPATPRPCVDCKAEHTVGGITYRPSRGWRPAPHPGPRCATHHRAVVKARKASRRARDIEAGFGITVAEFDAIVLEQGGGCGVCGGARRRAAARRLAVDHDHEHCAGRYGCRECVRGALCDPCNRLLGHLADDPALLVKAANYLMRPPARRALGGAS